MTNPKLALIPSGYKATKVYSILPSDGSGDFTFDRASEGTRVRKDGLIEEVTDDVPRLDWLNSNCSSLLLEPQRTNLITYSEDFSSLDIRNNAVVTSDAILSPSGLLNADEITFDGTSSGRVQEAITVTDNQSYTISLYLKNKNLSDTTQVWIGFSSASQGNYVTITDEWQRYDITITSDNTTEYPRIQFDGTGSLYAWGFQVEAGSYATSYIKSNSGSITTRLKDECLNGGDSDLFDITEGTFFVDANNFGTPYLDFSMITLSDGSSNFVRFIYEGSRIRTSVENGSIQQDYFITGVNDNQRNKVAITFKENEFKTYLNGVLKDTDLIGVVPTNLDRLNFANQSGTIRHFEGKVYDTRVYDRVLTEAEAIELTTL